MVLGPKCSRGLQLLRTSGEGKGGGGVELKARFGPNVIVLGLKYSFGLLLLMGGGRGGGGGGGGRGVLFFLQPCLVSVEYRRKGNHRGIVNEDQDTQEMRRSLLDDELMLNVLRMSFDILGTSCDQCRSTVQ